MGVRHLVTTTKSITTFRTKQNDTQHEIQSVVLGVIYAECN